MRVLVTGGAGFIGSHTCKALARNGDEVVVYDNLETGHLEFVKWGPLIHGDIADTQKLRKVLQKYKPDAVIHFAGFIQVGESVGDPGKYYRNNVSSALNLFEAMRDEDIHNIVVSGSAAVYGATVAESLNEDMPVKPINPYGKSKLIMEEMLEDFHTAHGLNWISLRYFNAAGSSPDGEIGELHNPETHLIPNIIKAALGRAPEIKLFGTDYPTPDGTCIRDYIHVDDLAGAHVLAAHYLMEDGQSGPLNLGTGTGSSVREVIEGVRKVSKRNFSVKEMERRDGDPARLVANPARAREVLGWTARKNLEDMITDAWNFLRNH